MFYVKKTNLKQCGRKGSEIVLFKLNLRENWKRRTEGEKWEFFEKIRGCWRGCFQFHNEECVCSNHSQFAMLISTRGKPCDMEQVEREYWFYFRIASL